MISSRYVLEGHDIFSYDPSYVMFVEESDRCIDEMDSIVFGIETGIDTFLYESDDESSESEDKSSTSKNSSVSKNIFAKLGDKIKEICARIKKFFTDLVDKIKNASFSSKSALDKFEAFKKAHPEEAANLKVQVSKGAIDLDAIKSLSELDKAYQGLAKAASSADDDELPTIKRKWKQIKEKFTSEDGQKGLNATKVSLGIIAAAATLRAGIAIQNRTASKLKSEHERENARIMATLKYTDSAPEARKNINDAFQNKKLSGRTYWLTMKNEKAKIEGRSLLSADKILTGLALAISTAIDHVTPGVKHKERSKNRVNAYINVHGDGRKIEQDEIKRKDDQGKEDLQAKQNAKKAEIENIKERIKNLESRRKKLVQDAEDSGANMSNWRRYDRTYNSLGDKLDMLRDELDTALKQ